MTNPSPAYITDEMWRFWLELLKLEPTSKLGGIYANKPGYHNTRNQLPSTDYSVQYALDRQGPGDKAAALDWTFPSAQAGSYGVISKYASRLLKSGQDLNDERGNFLREFYGQADSDTAVEGWDFQRVVPASSDSSHLWHIHFSFMRAYLKNWKAFDAVLSILKGESVAAWRLRTTAPATPQETEMTPADLLNTLVASPALGLNIKVADWLKKGEEARREAVALRAEVTALQAKVDNFKVNVAVTPESFTPEVLAALAKAVNDDLHRRLET